ncbi:UDP-N-acetylmuramoyl-L-alanyl-D-glutamate--2,6-diaminopimelate ligase [Deinococcus proteolyticus MRP]|uniref:UDP-N-acetylmuramyl-tripeptide synthetase n=1 Tax=Deinococcus proteolyticus (strain ATCC 35074 / DSM 20540 / JCM 6276 / NBRC 101906 / NCIMB 13154 / VKM Ac-1939 / CCM 2703 / MRP) TaxID=693977 RepID=F0RP26_DEIPM|nr:MULTISPECIES: UDP-N-acetylmuramoyl-L-alanyl-D-glutamate--2,6-diaminopimelate ligase [Deinococcus]ADY25341.1 UDP-N-acetylmuramoyl-L-alanyl-D-glutamate--2,6-diaminopimelate ligase [Deinococcus proteolyticus MRP]MCY1701463.1 UDP-N-acetylmuramoyl-L-alanyl-D-glutamate--2,6-diaminopimelate ligase [Deinococcus sp. SL84]
MKLAALAAALNLPAPTQTPEADVTGVTHNAAWAEPGSLFVAVRGARADGHSFIAQAQERGAVAVLGEGLPTGVQTTLPYLQVPDARAALADLAAELHGHPSRDLKVVGVTGTDGKTTTSWLTRHLLRAAGLPTGLLSTAGYELPDGKLRQFPAHFTTPEAPQLQSILRELLQAGAQAAVLEASSHALALHRVRGVAWDAAIWTHLTREHLDFHGSVEGYFADKRRLIEAAPFAVLNADDPWTEQLRGVAPQEVTYSAEGGAADWQADKVQQSGRGLSFRVHSPLGEFAAELPMIGAFNVANALAAMAAAAHLGATAEQLQAGLASFGGVPGRMQLVRGPAGPQPRVIVDFAHTPPSLEKALQTLRSTTGGQLWVVIGSAGGNRDPLKRAPLGEVAGRCADQAIFTEEDHRETPLQDILAAMERGAREGGHSNFRSIPDRQEAIRYAVTQAQPGDTVLLAGKGPEDTLERDTETVPWNETREAEEALALRRP